MRSESPRGDLAAVVRDAARESLAVGGVRFYRRRARACDGGWTEPWSWEVGVADPASRSARFRHFYSNDSPVRRISDAAARRWPWLDDEDPLSDRDLDEGEESIEIGRRHYYGGGADGWIEWGEKGPDLQARTLWPLEALLGTVTATQAQDTEVRDESCTCYVATILPKDAAAEGVDLVDPPKPTDGWRALQAEVCIDGEGLIRRIVWSPAFSKRFTPGLLPRIASSVAKKPPVTDEAERRIWYLIEFWDYRCEVDISAPTELVDTSDKSLRTIARDLWRMRRDYKKRDRPERRNHHHAAG